MDHVYREHISIMTYTNETSESVRDDEENGDAIFHEYQKISLQGRFHLIKRGALYVPMCRQKLKDGVHLIISDSVYFNLKFLFYSKFHCGFCCYNYKFMWICFFYVT